MDEQDVKQKHQQAVTRWPKVSWPLGAFQAHLGDAAPPYPIDLYLGGAAGHRLDGSWDTIDTDLGPPTCRVLQRQPTADYTIEDLWGDTVLRLMEDDPQPDALDDGRQPARIIRYRGKVKLMNYLIVVAKRLAIARQRRSKPILGLTTSRDDDAPSHDPTDLRDDGPSADIEQRETIATMQATLAKAHQNLSAEQQFLIRMVYQDGMKQKEAGAMLGWSEFKTSRQLKAAMTSLREAVAALEGVDWTPQLAAAWEGAWAGNWQSVQEPSGNTSNRLSTNNGEPS